MECQHPIQAVRALKTMASGTGGAALIVCGSHPRRFFCGTHREPAQTLLESILTFVDGTSYREIVLAAGSGPHLPSIKVGAHVRLRDSRAILFLRGNAGEVVAEKPSEQQPRRSFQIDLTGRDREKRRESWNRIHVDAQNMDWKSRMAALLKHLEIWCGLDHLGGKLPDDAQRRIRRLILIDCEYLIPDAARWREEIADARAEAGLLPARFGRVPESVKGTATDVVLLARDQAEARSLEGGTLITRRLAGEAADHGQLRLELKDVPVEIMPRQLSDSLDEFYPSSSAAPYELFRRVPPLSPGISWVRPIEDLSAEEIFRRMRKEVIGQDNALRLIANTIYTNVVNRGRADNRPIARFILAGPTGSGKTETAKALAKALFGRTDHRFHDIKMDGCKSSPNALFGWERQFQGYTEDMRLTGGGLITKPLIADPDQTQVILLDELEKAHVETPEVLFSALDEGHARDTTSGHSVSFRNAIILVTTNVAAVQLAALGDAGTLWEMMLKDTPEMLNRFGPVSWSMAFLGRFDRVLPLVYPGRADLSEIARKLVRRIIEARHRFVEVSPIYLESAIASYNRALGIRNLKKALVDRLGPQLVPFNLGEGGPRPLAVGDDGTVTEVMV